MILKSDKQGFNTKTFLANCTSFADFFLLNFYACHSIGIKDFAVRVDFKNWYKLGHHCRLFVYVLLAKPFSSSYL